MAHIDEGHEGCMILSVCFIYLQSVCAELEAMDVWNPTTVRKALKLMNDICGPLSWIPLLEPKMQAWEAMIAGAASAVGLQVDHPLCLSMDAVEDVEEKGV